MIQWSVLITDVGILIPVIDNFYYQEQSFIVTEENRPLKSNCTKIPKMLYKYKERERQIDR